MVNNRTKNGQFAKGWGTHHGSYKREYRVWWDMVNRCTKPNTKRYEDYGGRGIAVCPEWMTFDGFYRDMGDRPSADYSLERINNDGNYCKENCRWATRPDQYRNRRRNVWVVVDGERLVQKDAQAKYGLSVNAILYRRRKYGVSAQQAFEMALSERQQ